MNIDLPTMAKIVCFLFFFSIGGLSTHDILHSKKSFGERFFEALVYIDDYWKESAEFWGKKISDSLQVWSHALDLGMKWKRRQESEE